MFNFDKCKHFSKEGEISLIIYIISKNNYATYFADMFHGPLVSPLSTVDEI